MIHDDNNTPKTTGSWSLERTKRLEEEILGTGPFVKKADNMAQASETHSLQEKATERVRESLPDTHGIRPIQVYRKSQATLDVDPRIWLDKTKAMIALIEGMFSEGRNWTDFFRAWHHAQIKEYRFDTRVLAYRFQNSKSASRSMRKKNAHVTMIIEALKQEGLNVTGVSTKTPAALFSDIRQALVKKEQGIVAQSGVLILFENGTLQLNAHRVIEPNANGVYDFSTNGTRYRLTREKVLNIINMTAGIE